MVVPPSSTATERAQTFTIEVKEAQAFWQTHSEMGCAIHSSDQLHITAG